MKITSKGVMVDELTKFTLRPNICSFEDIDGATFNINTITLISMYEMLQATLRIEHNITIEDIKKKYNQEK